MKKLIASILTFVMVLGLSATAFAADAAEADPEGYRNGYPIVTIESEIAVQDNFTSTAEKKYQKDVPEEHQGWIIFYGASNFARWSTMVLDLPEYKIMNHAFGGSTDIDLVHFANELLFPYNPSIVFFQTGSNDYVNLEGTDEERVEKCMNFKRQMFDAFHEIMPDAKFVIMSGLLLPGRAEYLELTQKINVELAKLAEETDYIYFVDASDFTYDGTDFYTDLFIDDGIHLTPDGLLAWRDGYIAPALEQVIAENNIEGVYYAPGEGFN